ncbi:MAG: V-type ATPase subunit subunit G family protein [Methanomicrobiales archaeon]|nr:V-type ATPase subunit subunit G family protein [Methanomicrobiales archaeon]
MAAERSLLQKIREKELEISIQVDAAREESERRIAEARSEAAAIIQQAEQEGEREARAYYQRELEKIREQIERMRTEGLREAESIRTKGEGRLQKAVERIVHAVAPE